MKATNTKPGKRESQEKKQKAPAEFSAETGGGVKQRKDRRLPPSSARREEWTFPPSSARKGEDISRRVQRGNERIFPPNSAWKDRMKFSRRDQRGEIGSGVSGESR